VQGNSGHRVRVDGALVKMELIRALKLDSCLLGGVSELFGE
jgi:hypothetical protein